MDKLISDEFGDSSCESIQLPSSSGSGELCNIEMNVFGSDVKIAAKGKENKESGKSVFGVHCISSRTIHFADNLICLLKHYQA